MKEQINSVSRLGRRAAGFVQGQPGFQGLIESFEREDDPDFLIAVCTAKRNGATPVTACFSVMDAKPAGLWTKPGPLADLPRRMLQFRARSFALRDAFPDVLKGLISAEEAMDIPASSNRLATAPTPTGPTIDGAPEPQPAQLEVSDDALTDGHVTPAAAEPPAATTRDVVYRLATKQGVTTFRSGDEWLACWAKIVRGCKSAGVLDKLQAARDTNAAHIAAVAAFDPEPAATLNAELDRALAPPSGPS